MHGQLESFDFVNGGRTYTCRVEQMRRGAPDRWWWFAVTGDRARYAPFRADAGDAELAVRDRVVAYYEDLVARRGWVGPRGRSTMPARG
jgi:hypothetical protein